MLSELQQKGKAQSYSLWWLKMMVTSIGGILNPEMFGKSHCSSFQFP